MATSTRRRSTDASSFTTSEPAWTAPWPNPPGAAPGPPPGPDERGPFCAASATVAFELGADRADERGAAHPDQRAEHTAERALSQRLAGHLAHHEALRPADRLQRAELARALRDRREREQPRDQERRQQPDVVRAPPSLPARSLASASEPVTRSARSWLVVVCAPGNPASIRLATAATSSALSART